MLSVGADLLAACRRNALCQSVIEPDPDGGSSEFLTLVANLQFELSAFEGHQAAAEIIPRNLPTIDNKQRQTSILRGVPIDQAPNEAGLSYLQTVLTVLEMLYGQGQRPYPSCTVSA
ncbi:hypothetical protein [Mesorhizobium sp.]|uniref:hypothetical protein n=1 Tax=Mesorhizobium sp. TaxID=1871066 RepID=UPI0025C46276|nr:hypothetical protein [Mesorhizobium sp.]